MGCQAVAFLVNFEANCLIQTFFQNPCLILKKLKSLLSLPVAAIFSSTLCGWCPELFAWQNLPKQGMFYHVTKQHKKKLYSFSQTSESNVKQAKAETRCALSDATDGVSQPQVKAQQQVRASQMQSCRTCAPAVEF